MARGILISAAGQHLLPVRDLICIAEPDTAKHPHLRLLADHVVPSAAAAATWLLSRERTPGDSVILLAVKPQVLAEVAPPLKALLTSAPRLVISILAGTTIAKLRSHLGATVPTIRAMPNLPAQVGRGTTALAIPPNITPADATVARTLFCSAGERAFEIDESLMDAFTAVAGSGPAYFFYLAEAMAAAAEQLGFPPHLAGEIVRSTLAGSVALLQTMPDDPGQLRAAVTSKGGTTEAAISVLVAGEFKESLIRAITAARDRGRQLGV